MFYILKRKISDWIFNIRMAMQRAIRGYSDDNCWSMWSWLSITFPKMLRTLRDMKNGAPEKDFEEVEQFPLLWVAEECNNLMEIKRKFWKRQSKKYKKENPFEEEIILWGNDKIFDRWLLVLSRIAYCLEQSNYEEIEIKNEYEDEYNKQVFGEDDDNLSFEEWWKAHHKVVEYDKDGKPILWRLVTNKPDPKLEEKYEKRKAEIEQYREDMKNEAFDLLKKYFYALWD